MTRFDVLLGDETKKVFVNPAHVVSFEEEPRSAFEPPSVDVIHGLEQAHPGLSVATAA